MFSQLESNKSAFCSFSRFLPTSVYFPLLSTARCFERSLRAGEKRRVEAESQGDEDEKDLSSALSTQGDEGGQPKGLFGLEGGRASLCSAYKPDGSQQPVLSHVGGCGEEVGTPGGEGGLHVGQRKEGTHPPRDSEKAEGASVLGLQSVRNQLRETEEKIKEIEAYSEKIRTKGEDLWRECEDLYDSQSRFVAPWRDGLDSLYRQHLVLQKTVSEQTEDDGGARGGAEENSAGEGGEGEAQVIQMKSRHVGDISDMAHAVERDLHGLQTRQREASTLLQSSRALMMKTRDALRQEGGGEEEEEQQQALQQENSVQRYAPR